MMGENTKLQEDRIFKGHKGENNHHYDLYEPSLCFIAV